MQVKTIKRESDKNKLPDMNSIVFKAQCLNSVFKHKQLVSEYKMDQNSDDVEFVLIGAGDYTNYMSNI